MKQGLVIGAIIINFILSCGTARPSEDKYSGEDFKDFYSRFNSDTAFQRTRIQVKLREKMVFNTPKVDTVMFMVTDLVNGDWITERITDRKAPGWYVEYKFHAIQGKWYMVEYMDTYDEND